MFLVRLGPLGIGPRRWDIPDPRWDVRTRTLCKAPSLGGRSLIPLSMTFSQRSSKRGLAEKCAVSLLFCPFLRFFGPKRLRSPVLEFSTHVFVHQNCAFFGPPNAVCTTKESVKHRAAQLAKAKYDPPTLPRKGSRKCSRECSRKCTRECHKSWLSLCYIPYKGSHSSAHVSAHAGAHASVHEVVWSYVTWSVFTCSVPYPKKRG